MEYTTDAEIYVVPTDVSKITIGAKITYGGDILKGAAPYVYLQEYDPASYFKYKITIETVSGGKLYLKSIPINPPSSGITVVASRIEVDSDKQYEFASNLKINYHCEGEFWTRSYRAEDGSHETITTTNGIKVFEHKENVEWTDPLWGTINSLIIPMGQSPRPQYGLGTFHKKLVSEGYSLTTYTSGPSVYKYTEDSTITDYSVE